jgi:8-oxo-dGTP pyrophosphatase MutT (NUDIX family)
MLNVHTMSEARNSSTVILARPGDTAPEFLLVERVSGGAFSGAHVFPGGVIEDVDFSPIEGLLSEAEAQLHLGTDEYALAFYSAAVRELFEETTILLADSTLTASARVQLRDALLGSQIDWTGMLQQHAITPAFNALNYVSFWVTPKTMPRRFATRFFFAINPADQDAVACGRELRGCEWMSAEVALERAANQEITMHPPTLLTLGELKKHRSIDALIAWSERRQSEGVVCIAPDSADPDVVQRAIEALA